MGRFWISLSIVLLNECFNKNIFCFHSITEPNFVGSFDIGEFVYFFFRETAVEYINCGKAVYSRIARVCKKDIGGKNILSQNWATYLKARLNCSISGEFPFYFNEIQAVYQLPTDKSKFYATFATSTNGLVGSAVCSFDINEVQAAFAGKHVRLRLRSDCPYGEAALVQKIITHSILCFLQVNSKSKPLRIRPGCQFWNRRYPNHDQVHVSTIHPICQMLFWISFVHIPWWIKPLIMSTIIPCFINEI